MKRIVKILSLLLALIFALSIFTACNSGEQNSTGKVTVQWVQGQRVLKEEVVEKGTKLTEWTPEVEGMEFHGWYERPYIKRFDFTKPITKSMRIYASFKSAGDEDGGEFEMPDWYLIGAGKGDLSKSKNWNHDESAKNLGLYAGEDGIYKVTLELYEGDQFKMTNNGGWTEEQAIDKMAGFANGSVKDENGNVVFTAGENNNFVVAEGQNGKYEITYDPNTKLMGFKLLEALESKPDDIRLIGDNNGWSESYGEDDHKFTTTDDVTWTYVWEVTTAVKFKVFNFASGVYYPGGVNNDLHIDEAGTYTITLNVKTRVVVVKDAYGNEVDVGFTQESGGGGESTDNPYVPTAPTTVYFVPNANWLSDGARFVVYYWDSSSNAMLDLVAVEGQEGVYTATIPAGFGNVIFCRMNPAFTDNGWNVGDEDQTGEAKRVWSQTENLWIQESGECYFVMYSDAWDKEEGKATGAWGNDVTVPQRPGVSGGSVVYLIPNNNWLADNARFAVYYWDGNGSDGWVSMTLVEGNLYAAAVPEGNPNIIFCRMDPAKTENNWSNKWNQTSDLLIPTDATNCYSVEEGAYDKGNGYWSTYIEGSCIHTPAGEGTVITAPTCTTAGEGSYVCSKCSETYTSSIPATGHNYVDSTCANCGISSVYSVVGSIPGLSWEPTDTAGDMDYDAATGVYTKVFTNVAAGSYEYKVVLNHAWGTGEFPTGMVNNTVTVNAADSTVTVTWNPATQTLEATVS